MSSALFSPITMRGLTLANRIVISPMSQNSAVDGLPRPWHAMHLGAMAVSGAGLVIVEATAVEAEGRITPDDLGLYNDAQETALTRLLADIRTYADAPIGIQLGHAGRKASTRSTGDGRFRTRVLSPEDGGWQTWGPSAIAFDEGWPQPRVLDRAAMQRVRDAYRSAAGRAARSGFDLLELHGAHGYLLSQFLSPLSNRRTDAYGGSLANRMRFPLECVAAVREVWPGDRPLGMRFNGADYADGGFTTDEAAVYAQALTAAGVDYVTASAGMVTPECRFPYVEPGYLMPLAEPLRRDGVTVMGVGMILSPHQAESIVRSGQADMVALARAALDDPRWPWHAAVALGEEPPIPSRYRYVLPRKWPGHAHVRRFESPQPADAAQSPSPTGAPVQ